MKQFKQLVVGALLATSASFAMAADNPLSVHVLNLENGLPSSGVQVVLEQQDGKNWTQLNTGITNEQGRIPALYPEGKKLEQGVYRVTFETGDWFKKHDTATFFPEVPVIFSADASVEHYHIPLLLSPYGFSTYRGN